MRAHPDADLTTDQFAALQRRLAEEGDAARESIMSLSADLGATQPWNTLAQLRNALVGAVPHLEEIDTVPENDWQPVPAGALGEGPFGQAVSDHYLVNPVARASELMAELSASAASRRAAKLAAE